MSASISFVGTDNFKYVIHNFCNVARTNLLHHTLNPSTTTIERRLQDVWARCWEGKFSDVKDAQDFVSLELQNIHLNVYSYYTKDITPANTLEKIKNLARSSFKQTSKAAGAICTKLPTHASEVKDNLRAVWTSAQKLLQHLPPEIAKLSIEASITNAVIPQNIQNLYLQDLRLAQTQEGLERRLQSYLNDLEVKGEGITATSLGNEGYPKIIDVQRSERISGFMKTLGNSLEMDYHLLYSFFLNDYLAQENLQIQVPNASMFDLEKAAYVDSSGKKYEISKYNDHIRSLLSSVALLNTDISRASSIDNEIKFQSIVQTSPTGFFELVDGLNLADFFREKYLSLDNEKKDHFWFSAGLITYLDLILGNQDRLIKLLPDIDDNQYSFSEDTIEESNLGNLMVSHDFTWLYAIDNGIGDGRRNLSALVEEKMAEEQAYTAFLKTFLGQEDFKSLASNYLIKSLEKAIKNTFQAADDYNEELLHSVLSDISQDNRITTLQRGMKHMEDLVTTTILPRWNHKDATPIKKTLNEDFVQTIQTRLDLFATLKIQSRELEKNVEPDEDMLAELQFGSSSDDWLFPVRPLSETHETLFSPVMDRSKNTALRHIANHLKELSIAIASQDALSRIISGLDSLEHEFLLPPDIQLKILNIKSYLSDSTLSKSEITQRLIVELTDSLFDIDPLTISPRLTRHHSWDDNASANSFLPLSKSL